MREHANLKFKLKFQGSNIYFPDCQGTGPTFQDKEGVGVRGGEGEQQIELDRRIIRRRISQLKSELEEVINARAQQEKRRNSVLSAALIGYTNVGKSSLMNRLCHGNVLEENKLFATLDSTFRTLSPNTKPPLVLMNTVGFLNNLPNTLIDGFKTTLDSAQRGRSLDHRL